MRNVLHTFLKMETIKQVIHMITYLASLDIQDAFYTVSIYEQHKKYLKFLNTGIAYQFEVIPNGIYVNDSLLAGDTYKDCLDNIHETKLLLEGFHIHPKKYVFLPTQAITFLGFEINTVNMTISLTNAKKNKIKDLCVTTLSNSTLTIRQVANLLGNIAASFEAVPLGRLHYCYLE